jgi:hypothetical protein
VDTANTQIWILLVGAVVFALIAFAAIYFYQKKQSHRLKQRFGPEYDRTIDELGSQTKAESELKAREKRVERLNILPLAPSDAAKFSGAWNVLQGRFVDNPKGVVVQADLLVRELMLKRGYPVADFERRAADISVDHPTVVDHYRAAQAIVVRGENGDADTEELRKAVVHYRALFDELLGIKQVQQEVIQPRQMEVHS